MSDYFANGVCFVALAGLRDATLVLPTLAEALGIQGARELGLSEQIKDVLREKHALLCIDNFDHVMMAAPLVEDLLIYCPRVKVLITSREALYVSAE